MRRGTLYLFLLALGACALALWVIRISTDSGRESFPLVHEPWFVVSAATVFLVQEALNPVVARLALDAIGATTRYLPQLLITLLSISANSTVPVPAGIPIRAYLQKRMLGITYWDSTAGMLLETIIGYGVTVLAAFLAVLLWLPEMPVSRALKTHTPWLLIILPAMGLLLYLIWRRYALRFKRLGPILRHYQGGLSLWPLAAMLAVMLCSLGLALLRVYLVLRALGVHPPLGPLFAAILVSRLAGVISFVPMGLGTRDASLAALLTWAGVPLPLAVAAASIDRILITLPYLLGGLTAGWVLGDRARRRRPDSHPPGPR